MPKITAHGGPSNRFDEDELVNVLYMGRTYEVRRGDLKDGTENAVRKSHQLDEEATEVAEPTETEGPDVTEPQEGAEGEEETQDEESSEVEEEEEPSLGNSSSTSEEKTSASGKKTQRQSQSPAPTTGHRSKRLKKA